MKNEIQTFHSFREFYPFYLSQHNHPISRRFHFFGLLLALIWIPVVLLNQWPLYCLFGSLLFGYGAGFIGHFVFEKNKPATFRNPLYSFGGDFLMMFDILRGKLKL
jgi:hypothetical protein